MRIGPAHIDEQHLTDISREALDDQFQASSPLFAHANNAARQVAFVAPGLNRQARVFSLDRETALFERQQVFTRFEEISLS